jgi:hypothetical protein
VKIIVRYLFTGNIPEFITVTPEEGTALLQHIDQNKKEKREAYGNGYYPAHALAQIIHCTHIL